MKLSVTVNGLNDLHVIDLIDLNFVISVDRALASDAAFIFALISSQRVGYIDCVQRSSSVK